MQHMVKRKIKTKEEWINYLNKIHNNKYDYSLVDFSLGVMKKIKCKCKIHGIWEVTLDNHSTKKSGCPKCKGKNWNINDFIYNSNIIHNKKYDYSKFIYINANIKSTIICPKHGEFLQTSHHHINQKRGCPKCGRDKSIIKNTKSTSYLECKARNIHFNDYIYNWNTYMGYLKPMIITCKKHGNFNQNIANHIQGQGCPVCKCSKGELNVRKWLKENNINYIHQHKFKDCKNKKELIFDFYLPDYNLCIEYDGEQHFKACKRFGGVKSFIKIQECDQIKNKYCEQNKIKLIRISYKELKKINQILNKWINNI